MVSGKEGQAPFFDDHLTMARGRVIVNLIARKGDEIDLAIVEPSDGPGARRHGIDAEEDALDLRMEHLALGGRNDPVPPPMKQREAAFALQQQNQLADGRLGEMQLFGGSREVAQFHDGLEGFELPDVHRCRLSQNRRCRFCRGSHHAMGDELVQKSGNGRQSPSNADVLAAVELDTPGRCRQEPAGTLHFTLPANTLLREIA